MSVFIIKKIRLFVCQTLNVKSSSYTRLCSTKEILTVSDRFPGPTLKARRGDKMIITVYNKANYNITFHWHEVRQVRNPWSDGPEYITQCPIEPGNKYTYKVEFTTEEGTMWWHAHSGWARATVHGPIFVYPKRGSRYPFSKPHAEVPIILGEWWKKDVMEIPGNANITGGEPILSDAYTINGQPGHLYPCSKSGTFEISVKNGKTYLLRIISAVMDEGLFFGIANHKLTLVGKDGYYTKQIETSYLMITPGQSMDVLLQANQPPSLYFMAARAYSSATGAGFDQTTTTAIVKYRSSHRDHPHINRLHQALRSLATKEHPTNVPLHVNTHLFFAISVNLLNCSGKPCSGPFGKRFSASVNNVSFVAPSIDILRAYYYKIPGVVVLEYNASVELVLQGTNVLASDNHPVHLHGYSFYVVGWGFGNFNPKKDPLSSNLVDPPEESTVGVPKNGWVAIRFRADNPGVWVMHCHIERHQTWGMTTVFLVKSGVDLKSKILPPPHDLPTC
ncbi:laccase-14 [Pyrus ussuriensis x Pyrus communis]|uniref:laccase n=1 Tax=Pyrus ussuriensis x Pyrus communis TaxID=2448454 RepID=A0A5N5F7C9_9ROSA|nr:laccase-14 [Pyrus ussuriensis x Pyrus communis]